MTATFGTVSVAMVTPFDSEGVVDYNSAQRLAAKLVADGADCILLSGTTGESPTTHQPEKNRLIKEVREAVGNDIFILAGAGSNDTAHAVRMARGSAESGADGLLVVSPYYNRPSQEGVYRHCKAVIEATDLPVMLYDIPGRTGVAFSEETLMRLAEFDQVKAVKDATGNVEEGFRRMHSTELEYYSGDDGLNFAWLSHGAVGVVSVVGHVCAANMRALVNRIAAGELVAAREGAHEIAPIINAIMGGGQGAVMAKAAVAAQGLIDTPTVRLPLVEAAPAELAVLHDVMREFNLL